jgi:hypothetical protein
MVQAPTPTTRQPAGKAGERTRTNHDSTYRNGSVFESKNENGLAEARPLEIKQKVER